MISSVVYLVIKSVSVIGIGIAIEIFDYENDYDYEHEKVWFRVNPRDISTSQLNASRRLHLWPITT